MAIEKSQGLQLAIASTIGTSITMSAISNATEGVATLTSGTSMTVGDIIAVTSGWTRLNNRVVRVKTVLSNDITLEGVNTSSTANYPAGEGIGSVREITAWTSITQLRPDFSAAGGGFEQDDITLITDTRRISRPGLAQAITLEFTGFRDVSLPWVATVKAASDGSVLTPFRIITASGSKVYGNAYWGYSDEPQPDANSLIYRLNLSLVADSISYAS